MTESGKSNLKVILTWLSIALYNFPSSSEYELVDGREKAIERALFAKILFRTNFCTYQWRFLSQSTFVRTLFLRFLYACVWERKYFVEIEERRVGSAYRLRDDCLWIYIYFQQTFTLAKAIFLRDIYRFIVYL